MQYQLTTATPADAPRIATLTMEAMNHECCQWFAGPDHTLEDFHRLLTRLIKADGTQYSWRNTLVIRHNSDIVGIATSYDGALLHQLRQPFIDGAREAFGQDHSSISDETQPGELYLDTLCVDSAHRHQRLARQLLQATIEKGRQMGLPTGLLVDDGNPLAEKLYLSIGFRHQGNNIWGGHKMRHLVKEL